METKKNRVVKIFKELAVICVGESGRKFKDVHPIDSYPIFSRLLKGNDCGIVELEETYYAEKQ